MKLLILNGPNLNLIGIRETDIYGDISMDECIGALKEKFTDHAILYRQSNHEGALIDLLQEFGFSVDGVILNAGAYAHTSIAIRDAIKAISCPVIELHISDTKKRESFRTHSYLTEVCHELIEGKGLKGYELAVKYFIEKQT